MRKVLGFIRHHRFFTTIICLCLFVTPIVVVHAIFKLENGPLWLRAKWEAGDVLAYIAGFEAFLGTVTLGALSLWQNEEIHKEHLESLAPCLSMKLISIGRILSLVIENTGATEAKDISITVLEISNNGENSRLEPDGLFSTVFELFPKESVQGRIALNGKDLMHDIFPQIRVHVSYKMRSEIGDAKEYDRTVTYNPGYDKKIIADVSYDNHNIESDVDRIARAAVRVANYLDGHQLAKFDEVDLLAGTSLRNDLVEAVKTKEYVPVVDRTQTILNRFWRGNKNET